MCDFSFAHYEEILKLAQEKQYEILSCEEYIQRKPLKALVLRHDVDKLPSRALEMAVIESKCGVHSTYFFRVFSNEYNIFDYNTMNIIFEIQKMGHEIGYHAEPVDVEKATDLSAKEAYFIGKKALELLLNKKVKGVASHREATGNNNLYEFISGFSNQELEIDYEAYDSEGLNLFEHSCYVTDGYEWYWRSYKKGKLTEDKSCVCQIIRKEEEPVIYLLTHPNSWFAKHYHVW